MNVEEIGGLVNEVASFFLSDELLRPTADWDSKRFDLANSSIVVRVCTQQDYLDDICLPRDSQYMNLNRWFSKIETWGITLSQFDVFPSFENVEGCFDRLEDAVPHLPQVKDFMKRLSALGDQRLSPEDLSHHVLGGILSAAEGIIEARVIFFGRRFGITEALFDTYKDGLFPFGYDRVEGEILCIRPA